MRFPEFAKITDWELKRLGEVCDYWNGASHESGVDENGEYYLISLNSIDIEGKLKSEMKRISYTDNSLQKDDLVMVLSDVAHGNFLGLTDIIPNNKYVLNQRMAGLRIKHLGFANPFFIRTFINYNQKYFKANGQGSSQLNLSKSSVTDFPILLPSIQEQQKIASCLSSLDELIEAHSQKLDLLKDHKKGLMQNLFPQEGEKEPKYRFMEFEKDGEWVERKLGEVGDFVGGGTPDTSIQEYWDGDILWYTPTEVKNGKLESSIRKITEQGLINSSAKLLPAGTILITTRATIGDVAITEEKCTTNQGFQSLIVNNSEVNLFWMYWILKHKEELMKRASGSTFKEIGKNEIINIPTLSPKKPEQQKIASCLSSLDELITEQAKKIEQLQQHKKGLMQGLFPKIED